MPPPPPPAPRSASARNRVCPRQWRAGRPAPSRPWSKLPYSVPSHVLKTPYPIPVPSPTCTNTEGVRQGNTCASDDEGLARRLFPGHIGCASEGRPCTQLTPIAQLIISCNLAPCCSTWSKFRLND